MSGVGRVRQISRERSERRGEAEGRAKHLIALLAMGLLSIACGDDAASSTTTGAGGEGGAGTGGGEGGGAASASGGTGGQGGLEQTCDDLGFCGEPTDPGCAACALSGGCKDELEACQAEPACAALNACVNDCPDGDQACFDGCEAMHMAGLEPLGTLLTCVLCDECPVSCAVDPETCP